MRAHYYHAYALAKDGRKQDAIKEYSVALEVATNDTDRKRALYQRGIIYREIDQHDGAMEDFGAAIALDPNYVEAYLSGALALQQADQQEAAMADYSKVIELDPAHAEAHHNRGLLHKKAGAHHLAIRDYSKALDIKPGYGRAQVNRGYAFILPVIPLLILLILG
ncbi:MAG: tetratricopeptide repeat protein [Pseudomonadales bacterium]|nr:tetratricopeptide repeat protein [Pseudomonadales bacterium]